jgi:hypothetical protein
MEIYIPVSPGLLLYVADDKVWKNNYATSCLPKGLLLIYNGQELTEEAVGFGFPVLKRGLQTIFPGNLKLEMQQSGPVWKINALFSLNLVERIHKPGLGSVKNGFFYATKNSLSALIRHFSSLRRPLTALSGSLRRLFGWNTTYEEAGFSTEIQLIYTFDEQAGQLDVETLTSGISEDGVTEIVVMNEQGARYFDLYTDTSDMSLVRDAIGCWDPVTAERASFMSSSQHILFTVPQVAGARLFRGRELVDSRLAWSGFGYSFSPSMQRFIYSLKISQAP